MYNFDLSRNARCEVLGRYIVKHACTVRAASAHFGISKSTVHKDVTTDLRKVNRALYLAVDKILQQNKKERHLRGGEATRKKYREKDKSAADQEQKFYKNTI